MTATDNKNMLRIMVAINVCLFVSTCMICVVLSRMSNSLQRTMRAVEAVSLVTQVDVIQRHRKDVQSQAVPEAK